MLQNDSLMKQHLFLCVLKNDDLTIPNNLKRKEQQYIFFHKGLETKGKIFPKIYWFFFAKMFQKTKATLQRFIVFSVVLLLRFS